MSEIMTAAERRDACQDTVYLADHDWDYAQWLHVLTMESLEHVEGLLGSGVASAPLRQLVQPVADINCIDADTWRDAMEDVSAFFDVLPISYRFYEAVLYGLYGVTPEKVPVGDRADWLGTLVNEITEFAARSDVQKLGHGNNTLLRISRLAASRYAIDLGRGEVDLHSMAVLGGIAEGSVRNLLSGANSVLERGPQGGIVAMSAASWLQKKKGFLASIWQEEDATIETIDEGPAIAPERVIFVPVARDGSLFTPDLMRNGTYQIGAKGDEENVSNFFDALTRLNSMAVPRWRRPNEKGLWGIVSGIAWQRIEKAGDLA